MSRRIAVVGHGDYAEALQIIGRGDPEPYFGMAYTLRVLDRLFARDSHLVISLNAPRSREARGSGLLVGMPMPDLPRPIPTTLAMLLWGQRVTRAVARFRPTHVLVRTAGILAWQLLTYCTRHEISTLVTFANVFDDTDPKTRYVNRQLVRLLNHPCVFLVGNHKRPATETMVEHGVDPRKCVAWDWPSQRGPADLPAKTLKPGAEHRIVYVGSISEAKGIGDLLDAVEILHRQRLPVRLTGAGSGPDLDKMRSRAASLPPGVAAFPGRVGNEQAFRLMLDSTLVCVPSRHEFSEGMPLTLTEALASRTPTIVSDHPVIARAFVDGEGVRFFRAKDPTSLANAIRGVVQDPDAYAALSRSTEAAFRRVECSTSFGDLVERWRVTFTVG